MTIKLLGIALIIGLLQGCAGTPSRALEIYEAHNGYGMSDYKPGEFTEGQARRKPFLYGSQKMEISGAYNDVLHRVFGAFPKGDSEPVTDSDAEEREVSIKNSNLMLLEATYEALNELGFEIKSTAEKKVGLTRLPLSIIKVQNNEVGCTATDQCLVNVLASVAWVRPEKTGSETDRYLDASNMSGHIVFLSGEKTEFDQRIFYQKVSEKLPPKMYMFMAANSDSYVMVNSQERLSYPYLLNQGKVLKFEKPVN